MNRRISLLSREILLAAITFALAIVHAPAQAGINWGVSSPSRWPNAAHHQAAVDAMSAAAGRYNDYGTFNPLDYVYVDYNSGVGTADGSYYTSDIRFGGTYPNERVALHELAHVLGSGQPSEWTNSFSNNVWTGPRVNQLIKQFDGEQAVLNKSGVHYYPYGLNYDTEYNDLSAQRTVAIVYAMRGDMGFGPTVHPSSATAVALTGSDTFGQSGFNAHYRWSDGYFAHAGAAYSTGNFTLRTPDSANDYTFAGDSVTVNNTNGINGGLLYKGQGTGGVTTIDNLILDGGYVRHANGAGDLFQLDGGVTLLGAPTIDAANGNIKILAPIGGTGSLNLRGSGNFAVTLASNGNNYTGPTVVQSITLELQGSTGAGPTTVKGGASLVGDGRVRGGLTAEIGSTVRVGGAVLPTSLPGGVQSIDNFSVYPNGQIGASPNTTGGVWTGVFDGTANADIVNNAGNNAVRVRGINQASTSWRGAVADLGSAFDEDFSLSNGDTGTYFFRVRRNGTGMVDSIFGLTDLASNAAPGTDIDSPWDEYAVLLSISGDTNSSILRAYSEGAGDVNITPVGDAEWLNVWVTIDNASKTYRVATSTGATDGTDSGGMYSFGRRTLGAVGANPLDTFGFYEKLNVGAELDDLYFVKGLSLTNPLALSPMPVGETLTVDGDFDLQAGATLALDLGESVNDKLEVAGAAVLNGVLSVTLDPGYTPGLNDAFTVLTAASLARNLTLGGPAGSMFSLAASTPTELVLTVVSGLSGDYNNDGLVDAADYTVWRDNLDAPAGSLLNDSQDVPVGAAQYSAWRANYGATYAPPAIDLTVAPEPGAALLVLLVAAAFTAARQRRSPS